jgi:hypothetical protein
VGLTRPEIQKAITCEQWQLFRVSLKGEPTEVKLEQLRDYVEPWGWRKLKAAKGPFVVASTETNTLCCDYERRCIQVLNYLTALSRGGQIALVPREWQQKKHVERWLREKRYEVLK